MPTSEPELRDTLRIVGVVALGGMLGSGARYGIGEAWPTGADGFPWSTFVINLSGCFALGVLMAYVVGREGLHPLTRPFLGTGLIGGYTTFSTYAVEANDLILARHPALGLGYLALSILLGLAAVLVGRNVAEAVGFAAPNEGEPT